MPRLPPQPDLTWTEDGVPTAAAFDDVYFSRAGGFAESEAVFLAGCGMPEAWAGRDRFAICELGFGTGLNALAVWRAWRRTRGRHAVLHMCSIEAFPLAQPDAARALAAFPEAAEFAAKLLERWPVRAYAPQRLWFPEDGFALTVLTGEAEQALSGLRGQFDAFFLDGFSPAKNGAMWTAEITEQLARLAKPNARAATFSVAADVRHNLESVRFSIAKKPGFGAKRDRLEATFKAELSPKRTLYPYAACKPKRVAIIGAGIAGASVAHALSKRNVETIVLDAARDLGAGASGNPAALVMPRLDRGGALREFFLAAYVDAVATYEALGVFEACGVEQYANDRAPEILADLLSDPPLPHDWFSASKSGALHARAGLVEPLRAVEAMLRGAQLMFEANVAAIERSGDAWLIRADDGRAMLKADAIVLACGAALKQFEPASFLPLELSRGQIEWGQGSAPAHARIQGSYVAPYRDGVLFGATFDHDLDVPETDAREKNIEALRKLAPEIAASLDPSTLHARASIRASTPDFAPIAGLMPDADLWLAQHAEIAFGGEPKADTSPAALDGVYILAGLGARGFCHAPILGERLAAEMFGEPQALSSTCLDLLHPARFLHRALRRGG